MLENTTPTAKDKKIDFQARAAAIAEEVAKEHVEAEEEPVDDVTLTPEQRQRCDDLTEKLRSLAEEYPEMQTYFTVNRVQDIHGKVYDHMIYETSVTPAGDDLARIDFFANLTLNVAKSFSDARNGIIHDRSLQLVPTRLLAKTLHENAVLRGLAGYDTDGEVFTQQGSIIKPTGKPCWEANTVDEILMARTMGEEEASESAEAVDEPAKECCANGQCDEVRCECASKA